VFVTRYHGRPCCKCACPAVMVCLADRALLRLEDYRELARQFFRTKPRMRYWFQDITARVTIRLCSQPAECRRVLAGNINPGCRKLIGDHPDEVVRVDFAHDRLTCDVETLEEYARVYLRVSSGQDVQRAR